MQLLAEYDLERQNADADCREVRDHHGTDEIEGRDDRTQQHHQRQQDDDEGHDDDESDVVLVVVARVPQRGGKPAHRYRGIGECGVGLSAAGDVIDRIDLIHRLGAERVEFGLHQSTAPSGRPAR